MEFDVVIIGAGIVGLATAYKTLEQHPDLKVCILEKETKIASHQTGNNSGVIHSGIYYKPGSRKALNCNRGYDLLLNFCEEKGINYELCGKMIVATNKNEIPYLEMIYERGLANGLKTITYLGSEQIKEKEPYVVGIKGVWVPQTGIVDYKEVAKKYLESIKKMGGILMLNHKVSRIKKYKDKIAVQNSDWIYYTKLLVNCGGLYSDKITKLTGQALDYKILPFRGEYYELKPNRLNLVNGLIYPVPDPNFPFLGVHFTKMINGGVEAGPNAVLAFKREGYKKRDINFGELLETLLYPGFLKIAKKYWREELYEFYRSFSKSVFIKSLRKLIPEINKGDFVPGGAGVRAQACDWRGNLIDDFLILEQKNVINVCNAPSPAATASLAIGEFVSKKIISKLGLNKIQRFGSRNL